MICKHILYVTFFDESQLFLHTIKWFQVLQYNSHNLTSIICLYILCSIWPINETISGGTTPGQHGHGSNGNEGVLFIPQISKAGASWLDSLMLYPGHSLGGAYPSV